MAVLYFLRHAPALSTEAAGAVRDADRPLSAEGRRRMERAAGGMLRMRIAADAILSSPLLRARETAAIVADRLEIPARSRGTLDELASGATWSGVGAALRPYAALGSLILVGHQPDLSAMVAEIVELGRGSVEFTPGSLARIDVDAIPPRAGGRLRWILAMEELADQ